MRRFLWLAGLTLALSVTAADAQENDGKGRRRLRDRAAWRAQNGAGTGKRGSHGGVTSAKDGLTFEFVVQERTIKVYVTDAKGGVISAKGFAGKLNLGVVRRDLTKGANHQGASAKLGYVGKSKSKGRLRNYLRATHSFGKADRQAMRVDLVLTSVPGRVGRIEVTVQLAGTTPDVRYVCTGECKAKSKTRRYYDPGQCPKCKAKLAREGSRNAKAPKKQDGDDSAKDGEDDKRPRRPWRRWPRRK